MKRGPPAIRGHGFASAVFHHPFGSWTTSWLQYIDIISIRVSSPLVIPSIRLHGGNLMMIQCYQTYFHFCLYNKTKARPSQECCSYIYAPHVEHSEFRKTGKIHSLIRPQMFANPQVLLVPCIAGKFFLSRTWKKGKELSVSWKG